MSASVVGDKRGQFVGGLSIAIVDFIPVRVEIARWSIGHKRRRFEEHKRRILDYLILGT